MASAMFETRDSLDRMNCTPNANGNRLSSLGKLAETDIETSLVTNLSENLHSLFDPVCEDTLPIYFGPLLGRLYLEGL